LQSRFGGSGLARVPGVGALERAPTARATLRPYLRTNLRAFAFS
jgi:hypothetical protein